MHILEQVRDMMDEKGEEDNGYVTLVNANIDDNGNITESEKFLTAPAQQQAPVDY